MSNIIRDAKAEIAKLKKMIKEIDDFLSDAPDGCLKWQHRRDKTYYYQQYKERQENSDVNDKCKEMQTEETNGSPAKWSRKYITNENISLAKALAKKHYYMTLKRVIQKQLNALRYFEKNYSAKELDTIYEELCDERKMLVESIEPTLKERVKLWNAEKYEKNKSFSENLRYETEQGDIVRSKSEVIIANLLYRNKKDIIYKYEKPLEIIENGRKKTIYPDFTIMNVHTGKVTYWEHAGLMDDAFYAKEFVKKMNMYIANDLILGRDVIVTFESQGNPLDIGVVKRLVKEITVGENLYFQWGGQKLDFHRSP